GEQITFQYDAISRLTLIKGPLPGASVSFTYDAFNRIHTKTDESGYTLTFEYDRLDRLTRMISPDGTFYQIKYEWLDQVLIRDRAGRPTTFEYNKIRQMIKRTDPLKRTIYFQWCKCGDLRGFTDPMGRTTLWRHDIQGRVKCKEYADGSK